MQLSLAVLLFSAVIGVTVASPYGELYGGSYAPEINNARQASTALSGDGGVSIASGSATAGGGRLVRALVPVELVDGNQFRQQRAFTYVVGGPNAGQVIFV